MEGIKAVVEVFSGGGVGIVVVGVSNGVFLIKKS